MDGGVTSLDIAAGLLALEPIAYLDVLWAEMSAMSLMGESRTPKELGVFVLTTILPPTYPHLLPLFLLYTVPRYLGGLDGRHVLEVNSGQLLADVIASSTSTLYYYSDIRASGKCSNFSLEELMRTFLKRLLLMKTSGADLLRRQIRSHPSFVTQFRHL